MLMDDGRHSGLFRVGHIHKLSLSWVAVWMMAHPREIKLSYYGSRETGWGRGGWGGCGGRLLITVHDRAGTKIKSKIKSAN